MKDKPKFCTECGQPLEQDAKFCTSCGKKIEVDITENQNTNNNNVDKDSIDIKPENVKNESKIELDKKRTSAYNKNIDNARVKFSYWLILGVAMYFLRYKLINIYYIMIPILIGWIIIGLVSPKLVLWRGEPKNKKRSKVFARGVSIGVLLVFMVIMTDQPLTPPVRVNNDAGVNDDAVKDNKDNIIETTYNEEMKPRTIKAQNNIVITLPPGDLNTDKELEVKATSLKPDTGGIITNVLDSYEITLGDVHDFDGDLVIEIPYDINKLQSNSPEEALEAVYYNEKDNTWDQIRCNVDNEKITLYMDHLTAISIVESNRVKIRQHSVSDLSVDEDLLKQVNNLSTMKSDKAMDKLEMLGWSKAMNYVGGLDSSKTFLENAMKFSKLSGGSNILKCFGASTAVVQVMAEVSDGDYDAATRDGVKGFINFLIAHKGSSALQLAGVGVFCIDYSLNRFATEAKQLREDMLDNIYNEYYATEAKRTPTDWYNIFWKIATDSNSQEEIKNSVDRELDNYVKRIWNDDGAVASLQAKLQEHGWTFEAGFTEEQKRQLENQQKVFLVKTLQPVFHTVEKNLRSKIIKENVEAKYRTINYLESNLPIRVNTVGGYPNESIKAELWNDDAKILESETKKITDPWSGWELAHFNIRKVDFITLGCPNKIKVIITDEDGKSISKTQELTFSKDMYGLRAYTNFEFDCPKKIDSEDVVIDDTNTEENNDMDNDSYDSDNQDDGGGSSLGDSSEGEGFSDEVNKAFLEYKKALEYYLSLPDSDENKHKAEREMEVKYKIYTNLLVEQ